MLAYNLCFGSKFKRVITSTLALAAVETCFEGTGTPIGPSLCSWYLLPLQNLAAQNWNLASKWLTCQAPG